MGLEVSGPHTPGLLLGSLFELLQQDQASEYSWGTRLSLAIDCANAVACLHSQGTTSIEPTA